MVWISVGLAVVCGAPVSGAVAALVRRRPQQRWALVAGGAVALALLLFVALRYAAPPLQAHYEAGTLDDSLSRNPAFAAIKKHDPQTYGRIMSEARSGLLGGRDRPALMDSVRAEVSALVQKRLPQSSNEAATEYMRVMVQEMVELRKQGGALCHRFLFGGTGQKPDLAKYVSANTMEADAAALSQVVRSATLSPLPVPQQADVASRLRPVFAALAGRYGADLALLQNPQAPGADADKLCSMTIDMYSVILQMPPADSGTLIRYLMGQS